MIAGLSGIEKQLGVSIPLSSLKTTSSMGCGDFIDLKLFGDWVAQCGLTMVQLLPINDTGSDASPYMALSSQALHPLYLCLDRVPGANFLKSDIESAKKKFNKNKTIKYHAILEEKLLLAKKIFSHAERIEDQSVILTWMTENPWVVSYAVFMHLKELHQQSSWSSWTIMNCVSEDDIYQYYNDVNPFFYVWLQYHLEGQLLESSQYLTSKNIILKGDLPIMMNSDSVDVWQYRNLFDLDNVAGAPPDFYNIEGQRWGFPCYNWAEHEKDNFIWWRQRIKRAERFFGAYRVDHILGFFRIWTIRKEDDKAALGYFDPSIAFTEDDLRKIGFDDSRIKWFSTPHIYLSEAKERLGSYCSEVLLECFNQLESQDLFTFKTEIQSDQVIASLPYPSWVKEVLYLFYIDRALIEQSNSYYLAWWYLRSKAYQGLEYEKNAFDTLVQSKKSESELVWKIQAMKLLTMMKESSSMMICAEDLGAVPDCLPDVLSNLSILSLKVLRWARLDPNMEKVGGWIDIANYPFLSVATLAVHDCSAIREWWLEEEAKVSLLKMLELPLSMANEELSVENCLMLLSRFIKRCSSLIVMLQIQDLLALKEVYWKANIADERVNYPGTISDINWSYKMTTTIEELKLDNEFSILLKNLKNLR